MNIGQYLKEIGKTKTELAEELGLSRPTLNLYINLFESGQNIDKDRYDIIFHRLFSDRTVNRDQFERKIQAVKFLLERDKKFDIGSLAPDAADWVARIHNLMVNDLSNDDWNKKVYETLVILITRYRQDEIFRELSCYFSDLNSDRDLSDISQQSMAYYSSFYKFFHQLLTEQPTIDRDAYNEFLNRRLYLSKERTKKNVKKTENIKKMISNTLQKIELEFQENGVDASEEELLTELVRRVKG